MEEQDFAAEDSPSIAHLCCHWLPDESHSVSSWVILEAWKAILSSIIRKVLRILFKEHPKTLQMSLKPLLHSYAVFNILNPFPVISLDHSPDAISK